MGRYDSRLKVYSGGWKNVQRVQVYNGSSWVDFGTNDSSNTRKIEVYTNSTNKIRITRNKTIHNVPAVPSDGISSGAFQLKPVNVWCTYGIPARGGNTFFRATIYKTSADNVQLFRVYRTTDNADILKITWLADGRIKVYTCNLANGSTSEAYSSNAVPAGAWAYLNITFTDENLGYNKKGTIVWNGVSTTIPIVRCSINNTSNIIGDSNLQFTGTLSVHGSGTASSVSTNKTVTLNMSDPNINNNLTDHTAVPRTPSAAQAGYSYVTWD